METAANPKENTMKTTNLAALRSNVSIARIARDKIEDCFSTAWREAHAAYKTAATAAECETRRLAKADRRGDWADANDRTAMLLGYL